MAQLLLSKAEFARLAGVSKPAVTKAAQGALGAAIVNGEVDAHHPAAVAYLRAKGKQPPHAGAPTSSPPRARSGPARPPRRRPPPEEEPDEDGEDRPAPDEDLPTLGAGEDLAILARDSDTWGDLTLKQIAAHPRFRTLKAFAGVLDALKTIEDIRKTRLHNEETEGELISRELVSTSLIGLLDGMTRRLLTDAPKTIARKTYAQHEAGEPVEAAEATVRDAIESQLRPAKATAERVLRNA